MMTYSGIIIKYVGGIPLSVMTHVVTETSWQVLV